MTLKMMQSLRKSWPLVPKMNLVNVNFSSGKSENLHFDVLILSKVYHVWAKKKSTRELCHNTEEWCKICRGTDLRLKNDMKNLADFYQTFKKSQNLDFNGLLLIKVYNFWGKKLQRISIYWIIILKVDASFKGKMKYGFINDLKNLVNFTAALKNFKICTLRNFFSQGIKCWAKQFQMSYVSWHWRVMQCLKKNWLVVWKIT